MTPEPLSPDSPLFRCPYATLTPHMATKTLDVRLAMGDMSVKNLVQGVTGGKMPACKE